MGKDDTYPEARDFVTASVVVSVGGTAGSRGTHNILVFANEDGGKIPQLGLEFMSNSAEKKY